MDNSIAQDLRDHGHRLTPQRLAILQILEEQGGHLTPSAIYERAVQRLPGLTEATVYRTLEFLVENKLALVAHIGDGHLVYESARRNHHHLICRGCGYTVEIDHHQLADLFAQFEQQTGFQIDCAHITFFGLCPACSAAKD